MVVSHTTRYIKKSPNYIFWTIFFGYVLLREVGSEESFFDPTNYLTELKLYPTIFFLRRIDCISSLELSDDLGICTGCYANIESERVNLECLITSDRRTHSIHLIYGAGIG